MRIFLNGLNFKSSGDYSKKTKDPEILISGVTWLSVVIKDNIYCCRIKSLPIKILKKEEGGNLPHCPKLLNTKYSGQKKKKSREFPEKAAYTIQDHKSQITITITIIITITLTSLLSSFAIKIQKQTIDDENSYNLSPYGLEFSSLRFFSCRPNSSSGLDQKKKKKKNENQENPRVSIAKISVSIFLGVRLGLLLVKS